MISQRSVYGKHLIVFRSENSVFNISGEVWTRPPPDKEDTIPVIDLLVLVQPDFSQAVKVLCQRHSCTLRKLVRWRIFTEHVTNSWTGYYLQLTSTHPNLRKIHFTSWFHEKPFSSRKFLNFTFWTRGRADVRSITREKMPYVLTLKESSRFSPPHMSIWSS